MPVLSEQCPWVRNARNVDLQDHTRPHLALGRNSVRGSRCKPSDSRGSTPKKQDSNFACRQPFFQLGNPRAPGLIVLRCSERGRGTHKFFLVLDANYCFQGVDPENPDSDARFSADARFSDARFLSWETLAFPAQVFCGPRKEAGGPAKFAQFCRQ